MRGGTACFGARMGFRSLLLEFGFVFGVEVRDVVAAGIGPIGFEKPRSRGLLDNDAVP